MAAATQEVEAALRRIGEAKRNSLASDASMHKVIGSI